MDDNVWYLVSAFSLTWIVVLGYVLVLADRQSKVREATRLLEELIRDEERRWAGD